MKRSRLNAKPRDRGTDLNAAHAWFLAVTRRQACVVCGARRGLQAHHWVSQTALRHELPFGVIQDPGGHWRPATRNELGTGPRRTLQEILWSPANGAPICARDHERHTNAVVRIPISKIPLAARVFARELGLEHRLSDRYYAAT